MAFTEELPLFEQELDAYYGTYPTDVSDIEREIDAVSARHPEWLPARRKALVYEVLSSRCQVKLFRHCPFYFEINTGKVRTDLGAGGLGAWLKGQELGRRLGEEGASWWKPCHTSGLSYGWHVLDDNHHALGYDNVFRVGLKGLVAQAEERLGTAESEEERAFLESAITGNRSLIAIAERFADEADRMAATEEEPAIRRRLKRIGASARQTPAHPPETFYDALNTILFMREATQALEGNGISVYGHLDRALEPYYQADLAEGRITREEAKELLGFMLAFSDAHFGMRKQRYHNGTNTTVGIGGCDAEGRIIFNDLTRMIIEVYEERHLVDPKLNVRASQSHPKAFLDRVARLIVNGCNSVCVFNDEVIIEADRRMGKALEDCRLYVGGGCQENVLENTEINSRATIYLNLLQVFLMGFFPERLDFFVQREGLCPSLYDDCADFEELYGAFLRNLESVTNAHIDRRNLSEKEGWRYNPCPLHSSTIDDCIANARDMMEGGARYSFGSVALTGIGTLIDSLFAVRKVVFELKQVPLHQLKAILEDDFEGEESLRQYLIHRVNKFGQEDAEIREFSARVFEDLARVTSGRPNTRGGRYEASLFSFRAFTSMGQATGATPDGRKAGEYLSQGMSPSALSLGTNCSIGQVLGSLEPLDLGQYPVVAILDVKLPVSRGPSSSATIVPVIERFLRSGGSVLQVNCVNPAELQEARRHPERHPDLVVRVSGYSAYFNTLSEEVQDEVIERTLVETGA